MAQLCPPKDHSNLGFKPGSGRQNQKKDVALQPGKFKVTDAFANSMTQNQSSFQALSGDKTMRIIPRDEEVQSVSYPPPVVRMPFTERLELPNRFLKSLYYRYPFLLPKEIPKESLDQLINPRAEAFVTTYKNDFRSKEDFLYSLNIARAPQLKVPYSEPYQIRDPETPYMPGTFCRITDYSASNWPWKPTPPVLVKPQVTPKRISEYRANIDGMAKYFKQLDIYTKPFVFVKHKPTLPN